MNKNKIKIRKIKTLRKQLEKFFIANNMKADEKILLMSQELDDLIVDYYQ